MIVNRLNYVFALVIVFIPVTSFIVFLCSITSIMLCQAIYKSHYCFPSDTPLTLLTHPLPSHGIGSPKVSCWVNRRTRSGGFIAGANTWYSIHRVRCHSARCHANVGPCNTGNDGESYEWNVQGGATQSKFQGRDEPARIQIPRHLHITERYRHGLTRASGADP